uniref:Uncharacterized protein n=2 Tax=Anguilla anguilla TaxID=7936 RepID=A0A0E9RJ03_ANGAN
MRNCTASNGFLLQWDIKMRQHQGHHQRFWAPPPILCSNIFLRAPVSQDPWNCPNI